MILEDSSESDNSVVSWSEDEDHSSWRY